MVDALLTLAETAQITNKKGETALHMIALSKFRRSYDPEDEFYPTSYPVSVSESSEEQEEPANIPGIRVATSLLSTTELTFKISTG